MMLCACNTWPSESNVSLFVSPACTLCTVFASMRRRTVQSKESPTKVYQYVTNIKYKIYRLSFPQLMSPGNLILAYFS